MVSLVELYRLVIQSLLCNYHDGDFFLSPVFALLLFLCRLYRSLGDYDVLRGIFTGHIGTKPITQDALEAEARGDFSQALKLYNEVTVCTRIKSCLRKTVYCLIRCCRRTDLV